MKQIALGLIQYTQDNDERFPNYEGEGTRTTAPFNIAYQVKVFPYVKSQQVFRCPSFKNPVSTGGPFDNFSYPSYGMMGLDNSDCPGGPFQGAGATFATGCTSTTPNSQKPQRHIYDADGAHLSWVPAPAITLLLAEAANSYGSIYGAQSQRSWGYSATDTGDIVYGSPLPLVNDPSTGIGGYHINSISHFEGYNAAFVDGHVKWIKAGTEQGYAFSIVQYCAASPDC